MDCLKFTRRVPPRTGFVEFWKTDSPEMKINFFLYCLPQKMMMNIFIGDLYSKYVVPPRTGVSSMYKGIYHIRNSLWGVATVDVWSSSTRTFQPKKLGGVPSKWSISFYIMIEKKSFSGSPKGTPHSTGVVELWKKIILQWKPIESGCVPQKNDEYFHWGPIFYVCSSARYIGSLPCTRVYIT